MRLKLLNFFWYAVFGVAFIGAYTGFRSIPGTEELHPSAAVFLAGFAVMLPGVIILGMRDLARALIGSRSSE